MYGFDKDHIFPKSEGGSDADYNRRWMNSYDNRCRKRAHLPTPDDLLTAIDPQPARSAAEMDISYFVRGGYWKNTKGSGCTDNEGRGFGGIPRDADPRDIFRNPPRRDPHNNIDPRDLEI